MKFEQAIKKVRKMAKGEYFTLKYKFTDYPNNGGSHPTIECVIYVDGFDYHEAKTWKDAIKMLDLAMNPPKEKPIDLNEMPKEEAKNDTN